MVHPDSHNFPISGSMLLTKANDFVKMYGIDGKINSSWIDRWKVWHMHAISFKPFHGEASSVNVAIAAEWMKFKVPAILNAFPPQNVFNVDETALFWKMLPNRTMSYRQEQVKGGKVSKDRFSYGGGKYGR